MRIEFLRTLRPDQAVRLLARNGLHPAWVEGPSVAVAQQVALGVHPHEICPDLRSVDARAYCRTAGFSDPDPLAWLCKRLPEGTPQPQSFVVAYWVLDRMASPRTRAAMEAALPRVDELTDPIVRAAGRSVRRALALADDAALMSTWSGPDELLEPSEHLALGAWPKAREVTTARSLVMLGRDQGHCVGQYCNQVHQKTSRIVTLSDEIAVRATVQFDSVSGRVLQCYGPRNSPAPDWCRAMASEISTNWHAVRPAGFTR